MPAILKLNSIPVPDSGIMSHKIGNFWAFMVSQHPENSIPHEPPSPHHPWFAIRVRSNYERTTAEHLRQRGYEEFSPSFRTERRWSDRKKTVEQFLFPGYVFSRLNPHDRLPVLTVPGVVGLVGFGKTPSPIPDRDIENIRTMVQSGILVQPWPFLEVGQTVLIERGPLSGVEGILLELKGQFRLVVSIALLQRSVSAEVDRNWVRPVRQTASKEILIHPPCAV
ncbi:MAG: UpxY family transcription antiterminator [Acidobacteriia bacterium]|nr:UpxY family transcription antiterminator [Terriglobia bacterium]